MRRPLIGVRRDHGARYLFITIVAFAVTVMAVRLYLDAAGYPRIGGDSGLHVAHMLWGGLLLVVAAVLIQLFVGRRALILSALAAGVGVGLFIDEVGKFITESNDYFFAPAAPIIYGAILLLTMLWLLFRREGRPSQAEATQGAIEALRDLADGRLSVAGRDRALERLEAAGVTESGLSGELSTILRSADTEAQLAPSGWVERGAAMSWLRRILPCRLERLLIRIGLFLNALAALIGLLLVLVVAAGVTPHELIEPSGPIEFPEEPIWLALLGLVMIMTGTASAIALGMSLFRHHERAMAVAQYTLLFTLVAAGLLDVYISQLGALASVLLQLVLLLLVLDQRSRMAADTEPVAVTEPAA